MQEYINGIVLIGNDFVKQNFAIKDEKILLKNYTPIDNPIDLKGKYVVPGFVDLHVHTRTPGYEYKEDINHVTNAAIFGGFTTIVAMANLDPLPDNIQKIKYAQSFTKKSKINIIQSGRATLKNEVVDFKSMSEYTNIFTDDGSPISDDSLMEKVLLDIKDNNSVIMLHEEDHSLKGVGYNSDFLNKLNLPSFGHEYESKIVKRDIELNKSIGARMHLQHISTKESIDILKEFPSSVVSAEVTPHHLALNNEDLIENDGNFKMNPPLGNKADQESLKQALIDGVINVIATDHAPHSNIEKSGGFEKSINGVIGLETAFAVSNTQIGVEHIETTLKALTINPAKVIDIDISIKDNEEPNIIIIDPYKEWVFKKEHIKSKSKNTPFIGKKLIGKVERVIYKNLNIEL